MPVQTSPCFVASPRPRICNSFSTAVGSACAAWASCASNAVAALRVRTRPKPSIAFGPWAASCRGIPGSLGVFEVLDGFNHAIHHHAEVLPVLDAAYLLHQV